MGEHSRPPASRRTGPSGFASKFFCSCCVVSQSIVLHAHAYAILRVSTAATGCLREMMPSHLAAFGEHVDGAVDADASWTTAVVPRTAPETFFVLQALPALHATHCRAAGTSCQCQASRCFSSRLSCALACSELRTCSVCALSNWPKDPMLLEDRAWMSAGLCSAPRVRGPRSKSMSCLCSSVWRLAERPCPNRFGLWAQRRAESRACKCTAVALCTTACSRWPTAQLGFAREPALSDQAWMLAGAEASTRWASFVQPVCICCR